MGTCEKIKAKRKVDLTKYLGADTLRKELNFSTSTMPEDLHYEESYEFIIPQDEPVKVKIFPGKYTVNNKGDKSLGSFDEVIVDIGEILVIYPGYCHLVVEKGRFVVLKVEGKYKILAIKA